MAVLWLGVAGPLSSVSARLSEVQQNDSSAFLPDSAESTRVTELQRVFSQSEVLPVILLWEAEEPLDQATNAAVAERVDAAAATAERAGALAGSASPLLPSQDGQALQAVLPLRTDLGEALPDLVAELREGIPVAGTQAYVTGPGGLFADFADGFSGIDGVLLLAAFGVVLVLLLLVYRSPLLPLLVIGTAGLALMASNAVAYVLAREGLITVSGQSQGIAAILVVGAATDYGLLLVARYREELHRTVSRYAAMGVALRRTWEPVVASGATVILGVLCLLLSDLASNRGLGPISAVNIVFAMLAALTFLPAVLVLLGRAAFWPFPPRYDDSAGSPARARRRRSGWERAAAVVGRRPRLVLVASTLMLAVAAALVPTFEADGIPLSDTIRGGSQAVDGQEALARHYAAGSGSPAVILTPEDTWPAVADAAARVPGVAEVVPLSGAPGAPAGPSAAPRVVDGLVQLDATLTDAPDSDTAVGTVRNLRVTITEVEPAALVGGATATDLDTRAAGTRDLLVIVPSVLLVVTLVLGLLLRAVIAPLLLLATVVLSFAATVGVAAVVFRAVGFPGSDAGILLIAFVFLVALGVDYNIFLLTRAREESVALGTRAGVLRALTVTGGVITSAGLVLAATFGALAVLPLLLLVQLAFLVAFGVLLDTVVVRSLVVPAAVHLLGDRVWWPGALSRRRASTSEPRGR